MTKKDYKAIADVLIKVNPQGCLNELIDELAVVFRNDNSQFSKIKFNDWIIAGLADKQNAERENARNEKCYCSDDELSIPHYH